jgi:hypothetical protein
MNICHHCQFELKPRDLNTGFVVDSSRYSWCEKPECPNYGLLQATIEDTEVK